MAWGPTHQNLSEVDTVKDGRCMFYALAESERWLSAEELRELVEDEKLQFCGNCPLNCNVAMLVWGKPGLPDAPWQWMAPTARDL
jgi:hypothetical protein